MTTNLTDMILTAERERALIRVGTVVSFTVSTVTVDVSAVQLTAGYLTSYSPAAGDQVALALQDASWLVLGEIATELDAGPATQSGTELFSFVGASSSTATVTFPLPFSTPPLVLVNIASGAGETARWDSRAIDISATGFTLFVFEGDVADPVRTWVDIPVNWLAVKG